MDIFDSADHRPQMEKLSIPIMDVRSPVESLLSSWQSLLHAREESLGTCFREKVERPYTVFKKLQMDPPSREDPKHETSQVSMLLPPIRSWVKNPSHEVKSMTQAAGTLLHNDRKGQFIGD